MKKLILVLATILLTFSACETPPAMPENGLSYSAFYPASGEHEMRAMWDLKTNYDFDPVRLFRVRVGRDIIIMSIEHLDGHTIVLTKVSTRDLFEKGYYTHRNVSTGITITFTPVLETKTYKFKLEGDKHPYNANVYEDEFVPLF